MRRIAPGQKKIGGAHDGSSRVTGAQLVVYSIPGATVFHDQVVLVKIGFGFCIGLSPTPFWRGWRDLKRQRGKAGENDPPPPCSENGRTACPGQIEGLKLNAIEPAFALDELTGMTAETTFAGKRGCHVMHSSQASTPSTSYPLQ